MIDEKTLAECELRTKAAEMEDEQYVFRLARRYLALREHGVMLYPPDGGIYHNTSLDEAADRLLENKS